MPALHDARGRRGVRTTRRARPADYGAAFSTTAAVGADGRLASTTAIGRVDERGDERGVCDAVLGQRSFPSPQSTPGTYYWQAWRDCPSCSGGFEVGPVVRFLIRAAGKASLKAPKRAFAGYPFVVEAAYDASSRRTRVQRRVRPGLEDDREPGGQRGADRQALTRPAATTRRLRGRQRHRRQPGAQGQRASRPGSGRRPSATTARTATASASPCASWSRAAAGGSPASPRRCPDDVRGPRLHDRHVARHQPRRAPARPHRPRRALRAERHLQGLRRPLHRPPQGPQARRCPRRDRHRRLQRQHRRGKPAASRARRRARASAPRARGRPRRRARPGRACPRRCGPAPGPCSRR